MKDESEAERQERLRLFPGDVIVNPWVVGEGTTSSVALVIYSGFYVNRKDVYRWPAPEVLHQLTGDDLRLLVIGFFDEEWYAEYERKRKPFIPTSTAATTSIVTTFNVYVDTCSDSNAAFTRYHVD